MFSIITGVKRNIRFARVDRRLECKPLQLTYDEFNVYARASCPPPYIRAKPFLIIIVAEKISVAKLCRPITKFNVAPALEHHLIVRSPLIGISRGNFANDQDLFLADGRDCYPFV